MNVHGNTTLTAGYRPPIEPEWIPKTGDVVRWTPEVIDKGAEDIEWVVTGVKVSHELWVSPDRSLKGCDYYVWRVAGMSEIGSCSCPIIENQPPLIRPTGVNIERVES